MEISFIASLIAAIASPIVFGFMNVFDKFIISKKVRHILGYTGIAGAINVFLGLILILVLDWSGITLRSMIIPAIAGVFFGSQFFFYFSMLKKEDISNLIGFMYTYPLIVALLSFIFLKEILSMTGYLGMALIIIGVLAISLRLKKIKLRASLWMLVIFIMIVAVTEFFIKVAISDIPAFNGIAINTFVMGLTVTTLFFGKTTRKTFFKEIKNIRFAAVAESCTFMGVITLYVAMTNMPATIVTSIGAIQPLVVIIFERIFHRIFGGMIRDDVLLKKIIPIIIIAIGVIMIYSQEILKLIKQ